MQSAVNLSRGWIFILFTLLYLNNAQALQVPGPLVDTEWLANHLDDTTVLDVRTSRTSFAKKSRHAAAVNPCGVTKKKAQAPVKVAGHIPGAVLILWKDAREKRKINGEELEGMVLSQPAFEKLMQESGVTNDSAVVITSNGEDFKDVLLATRLYWMMKYYGYTNIAILDGGTKKWIEEKHKVRFGRSRAKKSDYQVGEPRSELLATSADVAKAIGDDSIQIIDTRGIQDYIGLTYHRKLTSPARKGHVPSAKLWPATTTVDTMGTAVFYPAEQQRQVAALLGIDVDKPTITYCWSGAQGSLNWYVMHELLGNKNARLYDGSMQEWSKNPDNPMTSMQLE
jgi:thiosulfate/3-mercaptopyruvate sulfurtransferase